ncbi:MAG: CDP-diacylglycerol--glycerol-3-phosphate 3-phosphatidyltransferase [Actinomycetaceae bacterium]|nr:CDP-diacylglycerol--glycerol-3-phosphate 3-phosphatidyltransferase [Actinomycetaceae bacterium]
MSKHHKVIWNTPNILTIVRIGLVPVFIALMFWSTAAARIAATVVFCVAAATDHLDGRLARRWGQVTDFGKLADPIADKALVIGAFLVFMITGDLPAKYYWWFVLIVIIREAAVTWLRSSKAKQGLVIPANMWGKAKTVSQLLLIFIILISPFFSGSAEDVMVWVTLVMIVVAFVATGLSGFIYFLDAQNVHEDAAAAPTVPTAVEGSQRQMPRSSPSSPTHAPKSIPTSPSAPDQTVDAASRFQSRVEVQKARKN